MSPKTTPSADSPMTARPERVLAGVSISAGACGMTISPVNPLMNVPKIRDENHGLYATT